jgi:hypothetical protein
MVKGEAWQEEIIGSHGDGAGEVRSLPGLANPEEGDEVIGGIPLARLRNTASPRPAIIQVDRLYLH